jgi:mono/diheme cytochrome c family protein
MAELTPRTYKAAAPPRETRKPQRRAHYLRRSILPLIILSAGLIWGCSAPDDGPKKNDTARSAITKEAAKPVPAAERGDPLLGKSIYEKHCRYCHGKKGLGDGAIGIALTPSPANFVDDTKRMAKSDEELYKSITDGVQLAEGGEGMAMPAWKSILTTKERWDVLAYVRQLEDAGKKAKKDE